MKYKVQFIPAALQDYNDLDGSVRKDVNKRIDELETNPFIGHKLGNKYNIDLTGFYKLYAHGKKYRIVYRLIDETKIEVIEIWGIGKREKEEIYRLIGKRLAKK